MPLTAPQAAAGPTAPLAGARSDGRRFWCAAALAALAALALRLAFAIDYAEEVDSIRFLLAVDHFDVTAFRPHFPGYPLYVLLGQGLAALTGSAHAGLVALGAISGALLVLPVAWIARRTLGRSAGYCALPVAALNPFLWLYSEKLLSDMTGLLFLFSSLALIIAGLRLFPVVVEPHEDRPGPIGPSYGLLAAGTLLLGLTLGVRLSYFPFVLSAAGLVLLRRPRIRPLAWGALWGALGVCCWAVPLLALTGSQELLATGQVQTAGHFMRWGGSLATESDLALRVKMLLWELWPHGLAGWWPDRSWLYLAPSAALALALALRLSRRTGPGLGQRLLFWLLLVLPYLAWAFCGQNITIKPRHALPLVVLLLILCCGWALGPRLARSRWRLALGGLALAVWIGGQAISGLALVREHQQTPSNAVLMARDVGRHCAPTGQGEGARGERPRREVVVYTASFQRHLERHAPCAEVVVVRRSTQARRDHARRAAGVLAYVVSDVGRIGRLHRRPIRRYQRNRYVQNARHRLALYRLGDERGEEGGTTHE